MTKTKTYRFTEAMINDVSWLAKEYNTTETEILETLLVYAACTHSNTIEGENDKSELEKYLEMRIYGLR